MSKTGRIFLTDLESGRKFVIEPIDNSMGKGKERWGDINPATGKIEGNYGNKYIGSIHEDESIITTENGFKNIKTCNVGESPMDAIKKLLEK